MKLAHSCGVKSPSARPTSSTTWSNVRGRAARKNAFNFRKRELDGSEVRTVRGQKSQLCPRAGNRRVDVRVFVDRQIIQHDDIAGP